MERGLLIWYFASFKTLGVIQSGTFWFDLVLSNVLVTASSVKSQSLKGIKLDYAVAIPQIP